MSQSAPPVDPELLSKRWTAKRDGKCNFCNKPFHVGDRIAVDPRKPWWLNSHSAKWANNYAHGECADTNTAQSERLSTHATAAEPEAPKRFSFDPRNQQSDSFTKFLLALRSLIDAHLGAE